MNTEIDDLQTPEPYANLAALEVLARTIESGATAELIAQAIGELASWREIGTYLKASQMAARIVNMMSQFCAAPLDDKNPVKNLVSMGFSWDHEKAPFSRAELTLYRPGAALTKDQVLSFREAEIAQLREQLSQLLGILAEERNARLDGQLAAVKRALVTEPSGVGNDFAELERRARAATQGLWRQGSVEKYNVFVPCTGDECMGNERVLLRMNTHFPYKAEYEADAAYIEAARPSIVLALIAELRRLRSEVSDE